MHFAVERRSESFLQTRFMPEVENLYIKLDNISSSASQPCSEHGTLTNAALGQRHLALISPVFLEVS